MWTIREKKKTFENKKQNNKPKIKINTHTRTSLKQTQGKNKWKRTHILGPPRHEDQHIIRTQPLSHLPLTPVSRPTCHTCILYLKTTCLSLPASSIYHLHLQPHLVIFSTCLIILSFYQVVGGGCVWPATPFVILSTISSLPLPYLPPVYTPAEDITCV